MPLPAIQRAPARGAPTDCNGHEQEGPWPSSHFLLPPASSTHYDIQACFCSSEAWEPVAWRLERGDRQKGLRMGMEGVDAENAARQVIVTMPELACTFLYASCWVIFFVAVWHVFLRRGGVGLIMRVAFWMKVILGVPLAACIAYTLDILRLEPRVYVAALSVVALTACYLGVVYVSCTVVLARVLHAVLRKLYVDSETVTGMVLRRKVRRHVRHWSRLYRFLARREQIPVSRLLDEVCPAGDVEKEPRQRRRFIRLGLGEYMQWMRKMMRYPSPADDVEQMKTDDRAGGRKRP